MFEKYWEDQKAYDDTHKVEMVKIIPQNSPTFNKSIFLQSLDNIESMSDSELRNFIEKQFSQILNNVFSGKEMTKYINLFQNTVFLDAFIDVLSRMNFYDSDVVVRCNTICYHYLTIPTQSHMSNLNVLQRMEKIARLINRSGSPRLLALGLQERLCDILMIARYSDLDLNIVIKRIDFIIITQPVEVMSQLMIKSILNELFKMDQWMTLFSYYMMDVLPQPSESNPYSQWVTEEIEEVNSVMNLAVLEIIDELPLNMIRSALINYAESYNILGKRPIRFSMNSLSDDYMRINDVINSLEYEGIIVP